MAIGLATRHAALDYAMAEDPTHRELAVVEDPVEERRRRLVVDRHAGHAARRRAAEQSVLRAVPDRVVEAAAVEDVADAHLGRDVDQRPGEGIRAVGDAAQAEVQAGLVRSLQNAQRLDGRAVARVAVGLQLPRAARAPAAAVQGDRADRLGVGRQPHRGDGRTGSRG